MGDTSDKLIRFEEDNWDRLADEFIKSKQDEWDNFVYEEYEKSLKEPDYEPEV